MGPLFVQMSTNSVWGNRKVYIGERATVIKQWMDLPIMKKNRRRKNEWYEKLIESRFVGSGGFGCLERHSPP